MAPAALFSIVFGLLTLTIAAGWRMAPAFLGRGTCPVDRLAMASLLGLTLYHAPPILAGQVTGLMHPAWWLLPVILSLGVLVLPGRYLRGKALAQSAPSMSWNLFLAILPALILAILFGLSAARWPARVYDAVTYHMVNPMVWWNTGQFDLEAFGPAAWDPSESQAETFPNPKAVTPWLALLLQPDGRGTSLAQWPFLLLLIPAVVALARRVGIRHGFLALMPVMVLLMPEVALQSQESYADLAMLASLTAMAWAGSLVLTHPTPGLLAQTWSTRFRYGLPLGLAVAWVVSTKPTGLILGPTGLLLVAIMAWVTGQKSRLLGVLAAAGAVAILGAQVLGGPWYWRGLLHYGNPVFPIQVSWGSLQLPGYYEPGINSAMMLQQTGRRGLAAWAYVLWELPRPAALSSWTGGLGAPFAILAIPLIGGGLYHLLCRPSVDRLGPHLGLRRPMALLACGFLLGCAVPTGGVARFLLFPALTVLMLLPFVLGRMHPRMALVILGVVGLGLLVDSGRLLAAHYYQQRDPAVLQVLCREGGQGAAREDRWPGDISVITVLREDLLLRPGARLASRNLRPWHAQPAQPLGRWFHRLGPSPDGETPGQFLGRVQETGATLLHVQEGTPEWKLAQMALPPVNCLVDLSPLSASHRHSPRDPVRQAVWKVPQGVFGGGS